MPESIFFGTLYDGVLILMEFHGYESEDELIFRKNNERIKFESRVKVAEFAMSRSK